MAPKRLLLEGPAIEPLLEKVWAEHGPDVTIVKAERVRVGGVAGFFAREQFEVTVEVPDTPLSRAPVAPSPAPAPARPPAAAPAPAPAPAAAPVGGIEALLAAAERADAAAARAPREPAAVPSPPPRSLALGSRNDDFDAIFGSVATGSPASRAARTVPASGPSPAALAPGDDDDPWVDGPPADASPTPRRPLRGRATAAAAEPVVAAEPVAAAVAAAAPVEPSAPLAPPAPDGWDLHDGASDDVARPSWTPPWEPAAPADPDLDAPAAGPAASAQPVGRPAPQPVVQPGPHPVSAPDVLTALSDWLDSPSPHEALGHEPVHRPVHLPSHHLPAASAGASPAGGDTGGALPRRVGRSFAPLPSAQHPDAGYALQRSAVLRLPDTEPRATGAAPLVGSGFSAPPVVTSLGGASGAPHLLPGHGYEPDHGQHDEPDHGQHPERHFDPRLDVAHRSRRDAWPVPVPPSADDHLAERLAGLGVPPAWLWDLPPGRSATLRELSLRIASAPRPSARRSPVAEPLVVVLADLEVALPVAHHLATGLGLDGDDVVVMGRRAPGVAPERCLPSRQELQDAVGAARTARRTLVVVLPAPVGAPPPARAAVADTLDLLAPDEVWAVVDATRRLDDTASWLAAVAGERGVDALALTNTDVTSAPAAALALAAPVVLVGDGPATPESWVALLAARLAAQDLR